MKIHAVIAGLVLGSIALVGAGCQSSTPSQTTDNTKISSTSVTVKNTAENEVSSLSSSETVQESVTVTMQAFSFSPTEVTVKKGGSIVFTNNDSMIHRPVSDDGSFDAGSIHPGESKTVTVRQAGKIDYHCSLHSSMTGSVLVQ